MPWIPKFNYPLDITNHNPKRSKNDVLFFECNYHTVTDKLQLTVASPINTHNRVVWQNPGFTF